MRLVLVICGILVLLGAALLLLDQPSEEQDVVEPQSEAVVAPIEPEVQSESTEPSLVERIDERSIRLDDRFTLRGSGTERDPYTISWELLSSARDSIDPAEGKTELPPHIALLDGAWVRVSGYYSSPLLAQEEVEELLVTLDSWDGCCIGLPPTPFDCLEVVLREPISLRGKHLLRFGTVTGRIKVEPFVVGSWLMGLYRLEDATLDVGTI